MSQLSQRMPCGPWSGRLEARRRARLAVFAADDAYWSSATMDDRAFGQFASTCRNSGSLASPCCSMSRAMDGGRAGRRARTRSTRGLACAESVPSIAFLRPCCRAATRSPPPSRKPSERGPEFLFSLATSRIVEPPCFRAFLSALGSASTGPVHPADRVAPNRRGAAL